tara:strand:+ start:25428 stop:26438 length:1011 start_codon:yes stop_codon:yes gene_type:complete
MKILIVAPSWVGDAVMSQTLFKLLKEIDITNSIEVLAPSWTLQIYRRMKEVSSVIEMPFTHGEIKIKQRKEFSKELKKNQYDQAIILPNSFKSALIPYFAEIPLRTGWRGELRYFLLNDLRKLNKKMYPRMVDRFCALALESDLVLPQVQYPSLEVNQDNIARLLTKFGIKREKRILAICPGAEFGPAKRWPIEFYSKVSQHYLDKGWSVLSFGSENDVPISQQIKSNLNESLRNFVDMSGKTELGEAVDLLSNASIVLTNDSGLMHIASAVDVPLLALFGPTSPEFTPPLGSKAILLRKIDGYIKDREGDQPDGYHSSMISIKPDEVINKLESLE